MATDTSYIEDLPEGPLDLYRQQASFDWKKLKLVFEDSLCLKTKFNVWKTLEADKLFQKTSSELTVDEQKRQATLQVNQIRRYNFELPGYQYDTLQKKLKHLMTVAEALILAYPDVTVKLYLEIFLFRMSVMSLGTERHNPIIKAAWNNEFASAFVLTEIAHGSDTKNMKVTATYDKSTQEFIINTPDFKAAKCWSGNLGINSTLAVVFAQLFTKGVCHGLHAFIVPVRDPKTLLPYKGIILGDGGEKIGLNGVDNGFIIFKNYRIPRENLLNKVGDVLPCGEYKSYLADPANILSATIGNLTTGRVAVMVESADYLINAVTIAVRYAAVRTQFMSNSDEEIPIIEYQLHQWRLFPYLAAAAVLKAFATKMTKDYIEMFMQSVSENQQPNFKYIKSELHALISASKPLISWTSRDAIQECREACGGHGYLKASGIGDLRNTHDARLTYEGDNNILLQQTSRWLLKQWNSIKEGTLVKSPLHTCSFLNNYSHILTGKCSVKHMNDVKNIRFILEAYEWLITYLVQATYIKFTNSFEETGDAFTAFNNSQVNKASLLSRVYAEYVALDWYEKVIQDSTTDITLKPVLKTLGLLYGLSCLDKHLPYFYGGNFCTSSLTNFVKDGIIDLCAELKSNAVAVVDALAPPDCALNSVLGKSDGRLYENLEVEFFKNGTLSRPTWWKEVMPNSKANSQITSKL